MTQLPAHRLSIIPPCSLSSSDVLISPIASLLLDHVSLRFKISNFMVNIAANINLLQNPYKEKKRW